MYVDMQLLYIYIYIHTYMSTISIPFKSLIEVLLFDAPGAYEKRGFPEAFATLRSISLRWYCSPPRFLDPGVTADQADQADHAKFLGELRHTRPGKHTKNDGKIHHFIAG